MNDQNSARGLTPEAVVAKALQTCIDEMQESNQTEGRLTSFSVAIDEARKALALLASRADAPPRPDTEKLLQMLERESQLAQMMVVGGGVRSMNKEAAQQIVDGFNAAIQAIRALSADAPPRGEVAAWESRWFDANRGTWCNWERIEADRELTVEQKVVDLRAYIAAGKKYEIRALYASPSPALPVAQDEAECENCSGTGEEREGDEIGAFNVTCIKCGGTGGIPTPGPALSEGLTEAVETALAWVEKEEYSEEYPHINTHYQMVTEMRKKDYFQMAGKILAAEVRRLSPAAPLTDDDFEKAFSEWEDGTILPAMPRKAFAAGWANALRLLAPAAPLEGEKA